MATGSRCGCSSSVCCCCCWYCCIVYSAQTKTKMQSALQWELGVEDGSGKWGVGAGHDHPACAAAVTVAESSQNIHGLRFRRTAGIALPLPPLRALTHLAPSLAEHLLLPPASPPTLAPHSPRAPALLSALAPLLSAQPPLLLLLLLFLSCTYSFCYSSSPTSSASFRMLLLLLLVLQFFRFLQLLHHLSILSLLLQPYLLLLLFSLLLLPLLQLHWQLHFMDLLKIERT